jgi:hypothetical protein
MNFFECLWKHFKNTRNTFNMLIFINIYVETQSVENFFLDKISFLKLYHTKIIYNILIYNSTIILGV